MPNVFLSSTYVDLRDVRAQVIHWLTGVFGTEMTVMETSGSDAVPPEVASVRRVRNCDLFVGIYAHRYGTIDPGTGKSITALELDEARSALSQGLVRDILLYVVEPTSDWLVGFKESDPSTQAGLESLKQEARQHTYTSFSGPNDLLFKIVRDVYRKLQQHFGTTASQPRTALAPVPQIVQQPFGMQYLTSAYGGYLIGRERDIQRVLTLIDQDVVTLLLGESGIGKTSLIHAGVIAAGGTAGLRCVYTRPLGYPHSDVLRQTQTSLFERPPYHHPDLLSLLAEASAVVPGRILVIVDQFEDVLISREPQQVPELIADLRSVREAAPASVRIILSYRADHEGRLGQLWQDLSGSPRGLPRIYITGIEQTVAWQGITRISEDLGVPLALDSTESDQVLEDLTAMSHAIGCSDVYPPYIQILIDHVWDASERGVVPYTFSLYDRAGRLDGIVGSYLSRNLRYVQDPRGATKAALVALVRSHGAKAQRSLEEISADSSLSSDVCETALERLIDLRLVRHIDGVYEITHDLLASQVLAEMVDPAEREFKRYRELFKAKAEAYETTGGLLTSQELLFLYKHRARVVPNRHELKLLVVSWVYQAGPALYWILRHPDPEIVAWLDAESDERRPHLESDKAGLVILRRHISREPLTAESYFALRKYRSSNELIALISENPIAVPRDLLVYCLRRGRSDVREACLDAVAARVSSGDWSLPNSLMKSQSPRCRAAYRELILKLHVQSSPMADQGQSRVIRLSTGLQLIREATTRTEAQRRLRAFKRLRPPAHVLTFARSLSFIASGRIASLIAQVRRGSKEAAEIALSAVNGPLSGNEYERLLNEYDAANATETRRDRKARSLATAIRRVSSPESLHALRSALVRIRLTPSARELCLAILQHGGPRDLEFVLQRIGQETGNVDFENHTELGRVVGQRFEQIPPGNIPDFVRQYLQKEEFWDYFVGRDRDAQPADNLLPLNRVENRPLVVRLAAFAAIGSAGSQDGDLLLRLAGHDYQQIRRAAAVKLVRILGADGIDDLIGKVADQISEMDAGKLAETLRVAEMEFFSVVRL